MSHFLILLLFSKYIDKNLYKPSGFEEFLIYCAIIFVSSNYQALLNVVLILEE
ncbi:hypothetical protein HMPREF9129_0444 [Peptoniphilus indolicus ATCC 29427]|uniref:Uncharacterized protein n=1 Tax=Peptoniphilus indolicus ATCC 29427 TaxID=997350 RepID=G4D214_9FIRM|nr:hypothetical protein HMPREF9129_0444 [Peptoniphilus indolicus ATCC 29427]